MVRRKKQRRNQRAAAVAVVVAAGGLWAVSRGDDGPSASAVVTRPEDVVAEFFEAQAQGDCDAVLDVVAEESWSAGGRTRDEFLDQCEEALEGSHHRVVETRFAYRVDPLPADEAPAPGDRLGVGAASARGANMSAEDVQGALVWEGDRWAVVVDPYVMIVGRSAGETVNNFLAAYNEGNCDLMLDHLSERAWSTDGAVEQDEYLETCGVRAAVRDLAGARLDAVEVSSVTLTEAGEAGAVVEVLFTGRMAPAEPRDAATLTVEGLEWVLDGHTTRAATDPPGPPFVELGYRDLQPLLPDQVTDPDGGCGLWNDAPLHRPGTVAGLWRTYHGDCYTRVQLVDHGDPDEAERQAGARADQRVGEEPSAGSGPNQRVEVPGHPEAAGILADCAPGGCSRTYVVQARGDMLVEVELQTAADPTAAGAILQQVIETLADVEGPVP